MAEAGAHACAGLLVHKVFLHAVKPWLASYSCCAGTGICILVVAVRSLD